MYNLGGNLYQILTNNIDIKSLELFRGAFALISVYSLIPFKSKFFYTLHLIKFNSKTKLKTIINKKYFIRNFNFDNEKFVNF